MKLKAKIVLLAIVPFLAAISSIEIGVRREATALAQAQHATTQAAYMASKEIELKHYVELATSAIAPLYEEDQDNARDDALRRTRALGILEKMDFGKDGYFFVYDTHGRSLMHPREPDLVGRDLSELRDPEGVPTIQKLLAAAAQGGGYVRYLWHRPSTGKMASKLGYVVPLQRWGWMIGTGIYLDDVDTTLADIDQRAATNIDRTMMWIDTIALAGLAAIALCALVLNITEYRSADAKLKRLAQQVVESQENERARLSRELHDGISQMMVSVKLLLESALARFERSETRVPAAEAALSTSLTRLGDTLREIRRISHALRPSMLDDLGVAAAIEQLTRELGEQSGIEIGFTQITHTHAASLTDAVNTVLFRIAQEALTNIVRHAHASNAALALEISNDAVTLSIADNGRGFDVTHAFVGRRSGVGLRNMRERVEALGGTLALSSQPGHTLVTARVPLGAAAMEGDRQSLQETSS
ncbi:histidine kinase [bacterium M00.F.Ca.ET.228.01.1.1]|uniref:Integral membrane sensor signal transduction histidine kinase n=3 Tax=Pseudomonadota TaxID=1224 RepID=E1TDN3_BURSG|nr:cache domain-containing protein [Paraburkholderia phenoliruptrix]MBW9131375.1 cache domain-containing protein [Paraburkholderia ginsengiterrae]TGP47737.1 histidine kinase [bacterium M00.F.Ca.ET.228.01.1.1]TGS05529.1 histidine kinase [bacterium M00.F.Ca.ET.191.01.1.1]TGU10465.1 histidine kinase [bacterium M00.F.Ca.ET.155.01.1.1]MBW0445470.1 cache domain-containing protein [Paraburkholderia phenoliruptrix]